MAALKAGNDVQQKLQGVRWQSPFVSAPDQVQSGQIGQKIVLNLELADLTVQLGHFGLMVDFFLLSFAEQISGVLDQFLFPAGDLGGMKLIITGKLSKGLSLRQCCKGYFGLKFCAVTCTML